MSTKTVVVMKELYAFKAGSPVSAYKITHVNSTDHLVKTTLSTLPCNDLLNNFAVSYVADNIVLTGGSSAGTYSAQTYLMDIHTDRW